MLYTKQAKILFFSLMLLFLIGLSFFIVQEDNYASARLFKSDTKVGDNFNDWAWSENYGWISFNSSNCDADGNGSTEACAGAGANVSHYGVNVNYRTGAVTGYAWSSSAGWICFGTSCGGAYTANLTGGVLNGNAKAIALVSGGVDCGEIRFQHAQFGDVVYEDDDTAGNYGEFSGWAWNGNDNNGDTFMDNTGMGWLKFKGTDQFGNNPYSVFADLNKTPILNTYQAERIVPAIVGYPSIVVPGVVPTVSGFMNEGDTIEFSANWTDSDSDDNARLFICKDGSGVINTSHTGDGNLDNDNSINAGINNWGCSTGNTWCADPATTNANLTCDVVMDDTAIGTGNTYWSTVCDEFADCATPVESAPFTINDRPEITTPGGTPIATPSVNDVVSSPPEVDIGDTTINFSVTWADNVNNQMEIFVCKDGATFDPLNGCSSEWCHSGLGGSVPPNGTVGCSHDVVVGDGVGNMDFDVYVCDEMDACSAPRTDSFFINTRAVVSAMEAPIWVPGDACDNPEGDYDLMASTTWTFSDSADLGAVKLTQFKFTLYDETASNQILTDVVYNTVGDGGCLGGTDGSVCTFDLTSPTIDWDTSYSFAVQVRDGHAWSEKTWFDQAEIGHTLSDDGTGINATTNSVSPSPNNTFTTYEHNFPIAISSGFTSFPPNPSAGEEVKLYPHSEYSMSGNTMVSCTDATCSYEWEIVDYPSDGEFKGGTQTSNDSVPIIIFNNDDVVANQLITLTVTDATGYVCSDDNSVDTNKKLPSWIETN